LATVIEGFELAAIFVVEQHRAALKVQAGASPATLDLWANQLRTTISLDTVLLSNITTMRNELNKQETTVKIRREIIHDILGEIVRREPSLATITIPKRVSASDDP
jgi:hypothetical protein